jgi:hypothetical protein
MLMALLHKLDPSIDEPILLDHVNDKFHGHSETISALDALIFAMTGTFPLSLHLNI